MENIALLIQSGSMFYNYKREYSVILLALINAHLQFIYVDVGLMVELVTLESGISVL